jgi:hypothetical protein
MILIHDTTHYDQPKGWDNLRVETHPGFILKYSYLILKNLKDKNI